MLKANIKNRIFLPARRTIGILGTAQSGKTVLLTSLINHLMQHKENFQIKMPNGTKVNAVYIRRDSKESQQQDWYTSIENETQPTNDTTESASSNGNKQNIIPRFPYELYREALTKRNEWPDKTTSLSRFDCRLKYIREGSRYPEFGYRDISFFDMPGERLADLEMTSCPKYQDWSDRVLYTFTLSADMKNRLMNGYGKALRQKNVDISAITHAYKLMAAGFFLDGYPNITPSTLILDQRGKHPPSTGISPEDMADKFFCGLSAESEFAPLPRQFRDENPDITKEFSKRYTAYRKIIAEPFRILLDKCDSIILLVDILDILEFGPKTLNSTCAFLQEVLRLFSPQGRIKRLGRLLTGKSNLKRLAIAAPKMDIVVDNDLKTNKPTILLKDMMEKIVEYNNLPFQPEYIPFYAAKAGTQKCNSETGMYSIEGTLKNTAKGGVYKTVTLPDTWPKSWEPNSYIFPKLLPNAPENWKYAPEQLHLDDLFNYVVEGTLYVNK